MARNRLASGDAAAGDGPLFEDKGGLPYPADRDAVSPAAPPRRMGWMPVALVGGLVAAGLWGAWVTKNLMADEAMPPMARVQLSAIVGEYVQAQARSASPPAQVEAEMRKFMASLDTELQRRSANGQIVLVGEAVLTKNVPDITDKLRHAVYASGVARPKQASAIELQQLEQQAMLAAQPQQAMPAQPAAPTEYLDPMAPAQMMPSVPPATGPQYGPPSASVSTFGGPDGSGAQ